MFFKRGVSKHFLQDYRGAIADFNKAIELKPNEERAYNFRGRSSGNIEYFYYHRGLAKLKVGQKESGCLDFSKAGEFGLAVAYESIKDLCN